MTEAVAETMGRMVMETTAVGAEAAVQVEVAAVVVAEVAA
jgi:hypothetical protein